MDKDRLEKIEDAAKLLMLFFHTEPDMSGKNRDIRFTWRNKRNGKTGIEAHQELHALLWNEAQMSDPAKDPYEEPPLLKPGDKCWYIGVSNKMGTSPYEAFPAIFLQEAQEIFLLAPLTSTGSQPYPLVYKPFVINHQYVRASEDKINDLKKELEDKVFGIGH